MTGLVRSLRDGDVARITLARAEAGNRLTNAMAADLAAALDAADDARAIVLAGEGADFCIGRDMPPPAPGSGATPASVMRDDAQPMLDLLATFRRRRQPVVVRVQGRAWGIGTVFAALADVTIAATDASFRLGELERDIPPCLALSALVDAVPAKALGWMVYSTEPMPAGSALAVGLASQVVEAAELDETVATLVRRLLGFDAAAVAAVKSYLHLAPRQDAARAADLGAALLCNVLGSRG